MSYEENVQKSVTNHTEKKLNLIDISNNFHYF